MANDILYFYIEEDGVGQRLDKWLVGHIEGSTRSKIQSQIKKGLVRINDKIMKSNHVLKLSEKITFQIEDEKPMCPFPEEIPLDIVFEDDHLLAINKPAGMMVHANNHNESGTLVNALLNYGCPLAQKAGVERPGIVHRLDKNTSGIILVAKNENAYLKLVEAFKNRKINKEYRALVFGELKQQSGVINISIDRVGELSKMKVVNSGGKESLTHFEVIEVFKDTSYLKVFPKTGRTHQIRVHLKSINHPVLCDDLYGCDLKKYCVLNKNNTEKKHKIVLLDRHALHAYAIKFDHPSTGKLIEIKANLPSDFENVLKSLKDGIKRIK